MERETFQMAKNNSNLPDVSILCTSYNHEKYIADALNGFLMQETNFAYEIIVHDDASTDSTQNIIKKYCQDYPSRIVAILQNQNQHSQGRRITREFLLPRAQGKYIALCEGDDYWTDPYKLQIQYDYMESHPDCMMCAHANTVSSPNGQTVRRYKSEDSDISIEECLKSSSPLVHTATYFIRKELYYIFSNAYYICPVGDYPLCIEAARISPIHYIDRVMSTYRYLTPGSWSSRFHKNIQKQADFYNQSIKYYLALDEVIPCQHELIEKNIERCDFLEKLSSKDFISAFNSKYYTRLSYLQKIRYRILGHSPKIYYMLKRILGEKLKTFLVNR